MHIGKKVFAIGLTAAVCLMAPRATQAAVLLPGLSTTATVTGVGGTDPFAGVHGAALATNSGGQTTQLGTTFATFWSAVYRDTTTGFLDFYYQVRNDSAARTDPINRETVQSFDAFATDVYQTIGNFGVFQTGTQQGDPTDRSANGNTIGFNFSAVGNGLLDPNEISYVLIVRTNAIFFANGTIQVIDGGVAGRSTNVPTAVPEPASILLLGSGLTAAAAKLRRRKKTA